MAADEGPSVRDLMGGNLNLSMHGDVSFNPEDVSPRREPPTYGGKPFPYALKTTCFYTRFLGARPDSPGVLQITDPPPQPDYSPEGPDDEELQRPPVCARDEREERREAAALQQEVIRGKVAAAEEAEDIDIDVPAPVPTSPEEPAEKEVSRKRAGFRILGHALSFYR